MNKALNSVGKGKNESRKKMGVGGRIGKGKKEWGEGS